MRGLVLFGVILAILLVVFALQNNAAVTVTFLLWRFESSLALVLLLSLAVGVVMVVLLTIPASWRRRGATSRQRRELAELQKMLADQERQIATLKEGLAAAAGASGQGTPGPDRGLGSANYP